MARLFGTDGVRGLANREVTAELALDLSVAAARLCGSADDAPARRRFAVVGRDPRASGEFLEAAVVSGLASAGLDVRRLGVLPTPAVAYLTLATGADLGVMLSASHNSMPDNGIKFFASGGLKLPDEVEDRIASHMRADWQRPTGAAVGRVTEDPTALGRYVDHLTSTLPGPLRNLRVVLDCAEGAASVPAPMAFESLGAEVIRTHDHPDGLNINVDCGSTHPASLQAAVLEHSADVGFAFDGDADRCVAVDADGHVVDGDQLMAVLAIALRARGVLRHDTVVATVMSNLGFVLAMREAGITVVQTKVGDRYVLDEMRSGGFSLGGEQSGHIVLSDHVTTGDGILTALQVAAHLAGSGKTLSELAQVVTRLPQVLVNVRDVDKNRVHSESALAVAVAEAEAELGETGRVLLRPSGTEPLVRVMVEAPSEERAQQVADRLADVVKAQLSLD